MHTGKIHCMNEYYIYLNGYRFLLLFWDDDIISPVMTVTSDNSKKLGNIVWKRSLLMLGTCWMVTKLCIRYNFRKHISLRKVRYSIFKLKVWFWRHYQIAINIKCFDEKDFHKFCLRRPNFQKTGSQDFLNEFLSASPALINTSYLIAYSFWVQNLHGKSPGRR